ncbi:methylmalonic aciduria and homocystinuria type D protein [Scenedesmus sp. NREL 46B-D3]|nr:methylmalonic aciduria and homocystinuria type D protein [Scenedesmus sp. NREL 46B-D3]
MALTPITTSFWGMEYSVHACPPAMAREVQSVFPDVDLSGMLIVPTCQQADYDLVRTGEKVELEKDRLLERFMEWSRCVCGKLQHQGYWCDYIDPCSGLPMIQQGTNNVYPEVEGLSILLGFKTQNAGCCKIVLHPRWGSAVYPATLFAKAPLQPLLEAIREAEAQLQRTGLSQP